MEQSLAFVFGIVIGVLLIALVYSVIGVVKLNKKVKEYESDLEGLHHTIDTHFNCVTKDVKELDERTHREVDEIYRNFEKIKRDAESHTDKSYDNLAKKSADAFKVDDFVFDAEEEKPKKVKKTKIEQINS
jgi:uncharacterized membrane-anchored protein YhcB (DUF1043 family)